MIFQGRPDRPPIVSVEDCKSSGSAKVKWSPGTNNNAPLTNFIIQYQTALDESIWYTADDNIATGVTEQVVEYVLSTADPHTYNHCTPISLKQ